MYYEVVEVQILFLQLFYLFLPIFILPLESLYVLILPLLLSTNRLYLSLRVLEAPLVLLRAVLSEINQIH